MHREFTKVRFPSNQVTLSLTPVSDPLQRNPLKTRTSHMMLQGDRPSSMRLRMLFPWQPTTRWPSRSASAITWWECWYLLNMPHSHSLDQLAEPKFSVRFTRQHRGLRRCLQWAPRRIKDIQCKSNPGCAFKKKWNKNILQHYIVNRVSVSLGLPYVYTYGIYHAYMHILCIYTQIYIYIHICCISQWSDISSWHVCLHLSRSGELGVAFLRCSIVQ